MAADRRALMPSWVDSRRTARHRLPAQNLPYGVFSTTAAAPRCGVAIGDIDPRRGGAGSGRADRPGDGALRPACLERRHGGGPDVWAALRARLTDFCREPGAPRRRCEPHLVPHGRGADCTCRSGCAEYTDFYAGRHHATNVGTMFRGAGERAAAELAVTSPSATTAAPRPSSSPARRSAAPGASSRPPTTTCPRFGPCRALRLRAGDGRDRRPAVRRAWSRWREADAMIFGYVLLNDWSARDIQAWEYQPLGPFQAKATATTISPWIVTAAALEPFRTADARARAAAAALPARTRPDALRHRPRVDAGPEGGDGDRHLAAPTTARLYYSAAQQLRTTPPRAARCASGDLLGSGTISGPGARQPRLAAGAVLGRQGAARTARRRDPHASSRTATP